MNVNYYRDVLNRKYISWTQTLNGKPLKTDIELQGLEYCAKNHEPITEWTGWQEVFFAQKGDKILLPSVGEFTVKRVVYGTDVIHCHLEEPVIHIDYESARIAITEALENSALKGAPIYYKKENGTIINIRKEENWLDLL